MCKLKWGCARCDVEIPGAQVPLLACFQPPLLPALGSQLSCPLSTEEKLRQGHKVMEGEVRMLGYVKTSGE